MSRNSVHFAGHDRDGTQATVDLFTYPDGSLIDPQDPSIFFEVTEGDEILTTLDLSPKQAQRLGKALLKAARRARELQR